MAGQHHDTNCSECVDYYAYLSKIHIEAYPSAPSLATACFTASTAPLYAPGSAVCSRVFIKSNGCPAHANQYAFNDASYNGHTDKHGSDASKAACDERLDVLRRRVCGARALDLSRFDVALIVLQFYELWSHDTYAHTMSKGL